MIKSKKPVILNNSPDRLIGELILNEEFVDLLTAGVKFVLSVSVMLIGDRNQKEVVCFNLSPVEAKAAYIE